MEEQKREYELVRGTGSHEELKKYQLCFFENGTNKNLEVLKWMHQENLPGLQKIYYALDKKTNDIVAIYAYVPVIMKCMDKIVQGVLAIDALTDYRHRSQGLFVKLASALLKEESAKNNELVYGFPNASAVHGQVNKVGLKYFGEIPFLIKPLGLSYLLKKIFPKKISHDAPVINNMINLPNEIVLKNNCTIKFISNFDEDYNTFWAAVAPQINIGVNRDAAYMNWRYIAKPGEAYARYALYENNKLAAVVIFALKNKHGGKIGHLMELLFAPKKEKAGRDLLKFASRILKQNQADLILAWCFDHSFNYRCFRKNGYYKFLEKLRPQKLSFIVRVLNSANTQNIYNIKNWYISYSDSDTV